LHPAGLRIYSDVKRSGEAGRPAAVHLFETRCPMNRTAIVMAMVMILCSAMYAYADTYTWTDNKGVVSFTDDPVLIPPQYRGKAKRGEDISIRSPKIRQELKEQEERAHQEEINRPRIVPTPDYVPPPLQPPVAESPRTAIDELPPGRPKSQRIRENIERREAEEKARQVEELKY
jgi:hypothetical protein